MNVLKYTGTNRLYPSAFGPNLDLFLEHTQTQDMRFIAIDRTMTALDTTM